MYKYKKQSKRKAQSVKRLSGREIQISKVLHSLSQPDRISDLPWPILDNILGRLSIQDAVRTSILSRQWRDKWISLSKLVFDDSCLSDRKDVNLLLNVIYQVMLSHCGPIHTFKLSTCNQPAFKELDSWIHFLSRNGIKKLTLKYDYSGLEFAYKLPSCIFSCQQLMHLHITNSLLEPPNTFQGFRNLVHLQLNGYINKTEVLASLIPVCPVLERLVLKDFENLVRFNIHSLKLKYLYLEGRLGLPIVLENCPALTDISFIGNSEFNYSEYQEQDRICHLVDDLSRLTNLKSLKISNWFLTYLNSWDESELCFTPSNHFRVLEVNEICLGDLYRTLVIASLFSNLQELYVSVEDAEYSDDDLENLEGHESSCSFNQLRTVKIQLAPDGYHKLELEFIKFVLARSPKLERVTIVSQDDLIEFRIRFMRDFLLFERASAEARIVFLPPPVDDILEVK